MWAFLDTETTRRHASTIMTVSALLEFKVCAALLILYILWIFLWSDMTDIIAYVYNSHNRATHIMAIFGFVLCIIVYLVGLSWSIGMRRDLSNKEHLHNYDIVRFCAFSIAHVLYIACRIPLFIVLVSHSVDECDTTATVTYATSSNNYDCINSNMALIAIWLDLIVIACGIGLYGIVILSYKIASYFISKNLSTSSTHTV